MELFRWGFVNVALAVTQCGANCYQNQLGCTEMCLCAICERNGDEMDKYWSDDEEKDEIL